MKFVNGSFLKLVMLAAFSAGLALQASSTTDYPIRAADYTKAKVTRGFWFDRIETNRLTTLRACFRKCNETPRIANFTNAAARAIGTFGGCPFDDSDVYKVMEGAAYIYATHPDPELMKYMTWLIGEIAKAQEPDGYLYTARTLGFYVLNREKTKDWGIMMMGPTRWSNLGSSHELYNVGHMIEAAVAWREATGHDDFLNVAVRCADFLCRTFGPGPTQLHLTSGHQEIELALCRLFRATGERRYLDLARYFLDVRGQKGIGNYWDNAGLQTHLPVLEQTEALGHAVRAGYMYAGMADVAALAAEPRYTAAITRLWENVVGRKLQLSGGIGSRPGHTYRNPKWRQACECFSDDYDLPNDYGETYLETCAAIANSLWNQRMFLATGESKYVDVLERTLYNGFPSGISLTGDKFFYPNPLASTGTYSRISWFSCSCCPVNDVRFFPQVPSLAFATKPGAIYWNLFMEGETEIAGAKFAVTTDYPWSGRVSLKFLAAPREPLALKVRIPGWAIGRPVPSDLYRQLNPASFSDVKVALNGRILAAAPGRDGYVEIAQTFAPGDEVTLDLPLEVQRIQAHDKVEADRGRLAVERGPIVYCAEGFDNPSGAYAAKLPAEATFKVGRFAIGDKSYPQLSTSTGLKLIPYCLWGNRQPGNDLQCWFKTF